MNIRTHLDVSQNLIETELDAFHLNEKGGGNLGRNPRMNDGVLLINDKGRPIASSKIVSAGNMVKIELLTVYDNNGAKKVSQRNAANLRQVPLANMKLVSLLPARVQNILLNVLKRVVGNYKWVVKYSDLEKVNI